MKNNKESVQDKITARYHPEYKKISAKTESKLWEKQMLFRVKLSRKELYRINYQTLKKEGKKKYHYLYCNEIGRLEEDESIFDYETLYDFDKSGWEVQKKYWQDEVKETKKNFKKNPSAEKEQAFKTSKRYLDQDYSNYQYRQGPEWFGWIEHRESLVWRKNKEELHTGEIISAHHFILDKLVNKLDDAINDNIPNIQWRHFGHPKYIKIDKRTSSIDFGTRRAAGREKLLEQVENWKEEFVQGDLADLVDEKLKKYSGMTFRKNKTSSKPWKRFVSLIIADEASAKKLRMKSFIADFREYEQPVGVLTNLTNQLYIDVVYTELLKQMEMK
jgi:hypothetical protein